MLLKRIGATLLLKNGVVVQSIGFKKYLPIGSPVVAIEYLNRWGIDEIVVMDLDSSRQGNTLDLECLKKMSKTCFTPITAGGGVRSTQQIEALLKSGADKVSVNHSFLTTPKFITEAAHEFGQQCIVVSLDCSRSQSGEYLVYDHVNQRVTDFNVLEAIKIAEDLGAGELLLNSVDRDGSLTGFEIPLYQKCEGAAGIPILALGGAGTPEHFVKLFTETEITSAFAGNMWHYTEHSVMVLKESLRQSGMKVRVRPEADYYMKDKFNESGRLEKKPDEVLDELLFKTLPSEHL